MKYSLIENWHMIPVQFRRVFLLHLDSRFHFKPDSFLLLLFFFFSKKSSFSNHSKTITSRDMINCQDERQFRNVND